MEIYASEDAAWRHRAAFGGKPVITNPDAWPAVAYHRTYEAALASI